MKRHRLDEILIKEGISKDKQDAFVKVTEGVVLLNGRKAISPAQLVTEKDKIEFRGGPKYVGRGALKLKAALKNFKINPEGKICADIGSATGGFTEILLQGGARKVYAVDTARGKLSPKLREDARVVAMEGADARDVAKFANPIDLITIDVSLLPLEEMLPYLKKHLSADGEVAALFKPQYETRDARLLRHGVIKDDASRENLLQNFIVWAKENSWNVIQWIESPIKGGEGNVEYLIHLAPAVPVK